MHTQNLLRQLIKSWKLALPLSLLGAVLPTDLQAQDNHQMPILDGNGLTARILRADFDTPDVFRSLNLGADGLKDAFEDLSYNTSHLGGDLRDAVYPLPKGVRDPSEENRHISWQYGFPWLKQSPGCGAGGSVPGDSGAGCTSDGRPAGCRDPLPTDPAQVTDPTDPNAVDPTMPDPTVAPGAPTTPSLPASPFSFDVTQLSVPTGRIGAAPDVIGDLLRSGGSVRLNYAPEAFIPTGLGAGANGVVQISDPTRAVYTDTSGNVLVPTTGQQFVFFRPTGGGIFTPGVSIGNVERVTLDGNGNEISVEPGFQLTAGGTGFSAQGIQSGVVTQSNPAFANVGIVKAAEGSNALPRDRVFFHYSFFDNVPLGSTEGINVNRFTPGIEKTFLDGRMSIEGRFPFATTLTSDFNFTNGFDNRTDQTEFGDVLLSLKAILMAGDDWVVSGGLQMSLPTADDLKFNYTDNSGGVASTGEFLRVANETVHMLPVLAGAWTPNDRFFMQGFAQVDFDLAGKPVLLDERPLSSQTTLRDIGRINDATFLYADVSAGYWITKDPAESVRLLTGFAAMVELHYNRTLTETDQVLFRNSAIDVAQVGVGGQHIEFMNLTVGGTFEFRHNTLMTVGFATPIMGGQDSEFDGELRVLLTHRLGPNGLQLPELDLPGLSLPQLSLPDLDLPDFPNLDLPSMF